MDSYVNSTPSPQPGDRIYEGPEEVEFVYPSQTQAPSSYGVCYVGYYGYPGSPPGYGSYSSVSSYAGYAGYAAPSSGYLTTPNVMYISYGPPPQPPQAALVPNQSPTPERPSHRSSSAPTVVLTPGRQRLVIWDYCQFCQNNREPEDFYRSHVLRDSNGKVVCPVLRAYNCPICNNGGGDKAHTKSYCPQLRSSMPGRLSRRHEIRA